MKINLIVNGCTNGEGGERRGDRIGKPIPFCVYLEIVVVRLWAAVGGKVRSTLFCIGVAGVYALSRGNGTGMRHTCGKGYESIR